MDDNKDWFIGVLFYFIPEHLSFLVSSFCFCVNFEKREQKTVSIALASLVSKRQAKVLCVQERLQDRRPSRSTTTVGKQERGASFEPGTTATGSNRCRRVVRPRQPRGSRTMLCRCSTKCVTGKHSLDVVWCSQQKPKLDAATSLGKPRGQGALSVSLNPAKEIPRSGFLPFRYYHQAKVFCHSLLDLFICFPLLAVPCFCGERNTGNCCQFVGQSI